MDDNLSNSAFQAYTAARRARSTGWASRRCRGRSMSARMPCRGRTRRDRPGSSPSGAARAHAAVDGEPFKMLVFKEHVELAGAGHCLRAHPSL